MEVKKISFGFMKTKKAEKPKEEENIEYIACVEEKSIKVIGGTKVEEKLPIVIPMKPNTLVTAEKLREIAEKVEKSIEENIEDKAAVKEEIIPENETLEQMAVRELMSAAKKEVKTESSELTLPIQDKLVAEDAKESTLEDYDSIPVQDFGMAMLRGMGWDPNQQSSKYKQPELRPKGLGLGADKVVKANQKNKTKEEEDLSITRNSFVRITTGKYSGYYGKVVSLDEENGRVMVDVTVKKETVSLSEFMMQAVTKFEYDKESKVINKETYDAYKQKEGLSQDQKYKTDDPKISKDKSENIDSSQLEKSIKRDNKEKSPEDKYRREFEKQSRDRDRRENEGNKEKRSEDKYNRDYKEQSREKDRKEKGDNKEKRSMDKCNRAYMEQSREKDTVDVKHRRRDRNYKSSSSSSPDVSRQKSKHKSKRHHKNDSDSSDAQKKYRSKSPSGKRDIDKKRKGKKKKRDRDRSPNQRKYRK